MISKLLELKKKMNAKRPHFRHYDYYKRKEVNPAWRRPRGLHNKLRIGKWGKPATVNVGYRSPVAVRGMHLNGFMPILVHNVNELASINMKTQGVLIAKVGGRMKTAILTACKQKNLKVLNVKNPEAEVKKLTDRVASRKKDKKDRLDAKAQRHKATEKASKKEDKQEEKVVDTEAQKEAERKEMEKIVTKGE